MFGILSEKKHLYVRDQGGYYLKEQDVVSSILQFSNILFFPKAPLSQIFDKSLTNL